MFQGTEVCSVDAIDGDTSLDNAIKYSIVSRKLTLALMGGC